MKAQRDIFYSTTKQVTENEYKRFVDYVYDFYGKNGIYDMGATRDNITTATIDYVSSDDSLPFYGDSLDRERVRDIILETV